MILIRVVGVCCALHSQKDTINLSEAASLCFSPQLFNVSSQTDGRSEP